MENADQYERNEAIERAQDAAADYRERVQTFFAAMAAETRKPHFGDQQRGWMQAMLTRAQEAGLYDPSKENA